MTAPARPPECRALAPLLAEQASGALAPDDARRVEAHLAGCAACRAEADAYAEAFALVRLPAPAEAERAALSDLPDRTLAALRRADARRAAWRPVAAGVFAAAAAAAIILAPAALLHPRHAPPATPAAATSGGATSNDASGAATTGSDSEPDAEAAWDDATAEDDSADGSGTEGDLALAAFDAAHPGDSE